MEGRLALPLISPAPLLRVRRLSRHHWDLDGSRAIICGGTRGGPRLPYDGRKPTTYSASISGVPFPVSGRWLDSTRLLKEPMAEMLRKQLLDTSRGRIVTLLRRGELTADDIATNLGLTASAVRMQITAMARDGVVRKVGTRPGTTRPSHLFELTSEVERLLSKAYLPVLTHLVDVFAASLPAQEVERLLRRTGTALAHEVSAGKLAAASSSGSAGPVG